jgi:hypothetical protein
MLTRFHKILFGALGIQLALVAFVLTRGDDAAALRERPILDKLTVDAVTRLQVVGPGAAAKPVDLVKRDKAWAVASAFDYPVDADKVTTALGPVAKAAAAAPIATSAGRHKQLHVAADDFERKLVITHDGKDTTLYLGSSAGARRIAVRVDGDDKVYAVSGLSAFTFGTEPRQWVDGSYVKLTQADVTKVSVVHDGTAVELTRPAPPPAPAGAGSGSAAPPVPPPAEHFTATVGGAPIALAAGESIDDAVIDRLVSAATMIDLAAPADAKRDASKPTATITIERKGTPAPAPVVLDVIADGASYWVHDRSLGRAVLVDKARIDELVTVDRAKLVKKPPPPPPPPGAGSGAGSAAKPGAGSAAKPG